MKKKVISLMMLLVLLIGVLPIRAEAASASGSSSSLRAGNSFLVSFSVSGSCIKGVSATISYDSDHLTLQSIDNLAGGDWAFRQNGTNIVMYDSTGSGMSGGSVFSASFTVDPGVETGTRVWVNADGETDEDGGTSFSASWAAEILPPLSGNNVLSYLSCSNGTLSPSFSSDVLEYSMTVPYEVSSLNLDWSRAHSGSSVSVSGDSDLSVGANTVSVVVTAENGSTRTYYIYVTREQDPNYVPSKDATLSELVPSVGTLSPSFDPANKKYVVYLPYETETIEINGVAADSKAKSVSQAKSESLKVGENLLQVICTAEDGTTTAAYQVQVIRMPLYAGILPQIIAPDSEALKPEKPKEPTTMEIPLEVKIPYVGKVPTWALAVTALVLLLVIIFVPIWFWGRHNGKARVLKQLNIPPEELEDALSDPEGDETPADEDSELPAEGSDTPPEGPDDSAVSAEDEGSPADEVPADDTNTASDEESLSEEEASGEEPSSDEAETPPQDEPAADDEASPDEAPSVPETPEEKEDSAEEKINLTQLLDDIHNM